MDQDTALKLFEKGAFLVLLDVPQETEFGMDWNSWLTGPLFKGVKMIPPGLHFVFYSSVNRHGGSHSPRTGFYHCFQVEEILVAKWNRVNEEIEFVNQTDTELSSLRESLKDLDKNLAAYPYETLKKWISLTDKITPEMFDRLNPSSGKILSVPDLIPKAPDNTTVDSDSGCGTSSDSPKKRRHLNVDEDGLPILESRPGTEIRFTAIPKKWYPDGASPSAMSQHSMDSSYILELMTQNFTNPDDILGELQFAFVSFVLGQVLDAFEQWKKLVHVICSCDKALAKYENLYENFLGIFYHQITEIPKDFFVDIVTSNNFLVSALSTLFSNIKSANFQSSSLQSRSKQFQKYLTKKFKWDFECEPDDWAPVVVTT